MEAPTVRLAVVGLGMIAREVHLPTLRRLAGVEVVGLVDAVPAALERAVAETGLGPGFASLARSRTGLAAESRAGAGGGDGILPMAAGPGRPTRAALALLTGYQRWLSPLLPGACRFWPTCSEYARLALLRHGLLRGGALALWRVCRCHRFARGGLDPPP